MRRTILGLVLLPLLAASAPAFSQEPAPAAEPTRVILFIGDGVGASYWTAARLAADALAVDRFRVVGLVDTRSSSSKVTDSAAGATAYATGVRSYNGAIGVGPDSVPLTTVLELAEARGMATGLVATSSITHATPAAFAAHVPSRALEAEIAAQMAEKEIEVLLGGGRGYFDGTLRKDGRELLSGMRGRYAYVEDAEALGALRPDTLDALLGLFAEMHMPAAAERAPTLAEMTEAALAVLDRDPDGFFLMVEGSQPDWRGHDNAPLAAVTAEVLDFDRAIGAALEYQRRHPGTLIVVTADHETGGLAIETDSTGAAIADYTTTYHTGSLVPLFAHGPGAEAFGGLIDNFRVGELLRQAVGGARAASATGAGR